MLHSRCYSIAPGTWDGAGKIGASELAELFRNLGHAMTYEHLVEVMKNYDVDRSGQIEFGEFLRMFQTELLDLQEVMDYMAGDSDAHRASSGVSP